MVQDEKTIDAFRQVLQDELRNPLYLTRDQVDGGWTGLFPVLAASMPAPFPIFSRDEERVLTWGYPLLLSEGVLKLRRDLESLVAAVADYRISTRSGGGEDRQRIMNYRDLYHKSISATLQNVVMNDYHRGLVDLFLLFHSGEVVRALAKVSKKLAGQRARRAQFDDDNMRQAKPACKLNLLVGYRPQLHGGVIGFQIGSLPFRSFESRCVSHCLSSIQQSC